MPCGPVASTIRARQEAPYVMELSAIDLPGPPIPKRHPNRIRTNGLSRVVTCSMSRDISRQDADIERVHFIDTKSKSFELVA
jgi:hypothetical protein